MTIKLEVGRRYVDGGRSGKPEKIDRQIDGYFVSEYGFKYTEDGRFIGEFGAHSADSRANLVALAPDEAPQPDELATLRERVRELEKQISGMTSHDELLDLIESAKVIATGDLRAENARLRDELATFLPLWAVRYAEMQGFPGGHLHPQHYDRMAEIGCRMDAFTRAALAQTEAENG